MENIKKQKGKIIDILKEVREWVICIVVALGVVLLINKFLIFKVYIPSESMVPTLNVGDELFVKKIYDYDSLKRGDIIVFYSKELKDTLIKRLIGLPGDTVKIEDGVVFVNGKQLHEKYIKNNDLTYSRTFEVPKGKYFFLGDNRPVSKDSRRWINPYIDQKYINAKAIVKVYPFKDFKILK